MGDLKADGRKILKHILEELSMMDHPNNIW
jgi:hypothetical protein